MLSNGYGDGLLHSISIDGISFFVCKYFEYDFIEICFCDQFEKAIKINGKIVYCNRMSSGHYLTGVKLLGSSAENTAFQNYILDRYDDFQTTMEVDIVGYLSQ